MDVLIAKALTFAAYKHRHQQRKGLDHVPYINHPLELVHVLVVEAGITDSEVICAAILHDTIEDTDTTNYEVTELFGKTIAAIVMDVTDDKTLPKSQRKQLQIDRAPFASYKGKLVKLADKIVNIRDIAHCPPAGWGKERMVQYLDWSAKVIDGVRGTHEGLEMIFDAALQQAYQQLAAADNPSPLKGKGVI